MEVLLQVCNLSTYFRTKTPGLFSPSRVIRAVDDISFHVNKGEVLSLVGESGCGKTTAGRTLTKLENSCAGQALFNGTDILPLSQNQFRPLRREIQMIFQDPYASLNPRLTVEQTLIEPLFIHKLADSRSDARQQVEAVLEQVGLDATVMKRHPHEFSGGQRQRIGIARVMILRPQLIIAEPLPKRHQAATVDNVIQTA